LGFSTLPMTLTLPTTLPTAGGKADAVSAALTIAAPGCSKQVNKQRVKHLAAIIVFIPATLFDNNWTVR
jgi:hypothetical protein